MKKIAFYIKQYIKMALQSVILPVVYRYYRQRPLNKRLVIFADGHTDGMPGSMQFMYRAVRALGFETMCFCYDFKKLSFMKTLHVICSFMKNYAQAGTVFICDYYLPVSSCKKRHETQVVQLWHACGAFKKFGYDSPEDIPTFYKNNPLRNCTLVTVSSPLCESIYSGAMHLPANVVQATGVSRTDMYFNEDYKNKCKKTFFDAYPKARGKKILLWAPTFRGNAGDPKTLGLDTVLELPKKLGNDWYVIIKLHPHQEKILHKSNCDIATEELLPVVDVLMTDYSSVIFDAMLLNVPVVLFAPDSRDYTKQRGFYLNYQSIPAVHVRDAVELPYAVKSAVTGAMDNTMFISQYAGSCDGHATERILKLLYSRR